jgi:hypothetical protein
MKKEELLMEEDNIQNIMFSPEKKKEWLKAHNFDAKVWELIRTKPSTPMDKEIMLGEYLLKRLSNEKLGFIKVSSIRKNRLFFNQIRHKETRRVRSMPYRSHKGIYVVLRKHRYDYGPYDQDFFFRGMRMSPFIYLGDEPLKTCERKCPFCGNWKTLTFTGGTASARDFFFIYFCERCKCLLYVSYDDEDGPIIKIGYRKLLSKEGIPKSTH